MQYGRQRRLAQIALLAFAAACGGWLLRLDYRRKISTDILDLIPPAESSPEVAVLRSLASEMQARVMLFALRDGVSPDTPPAEAARAFASQLGRSPAFAEAIALRDANFGLKFGRALFERRDELLLPTWLAEQERAFAATGKPRREFAEWTAETAAARLEAFLARPEAFPMQRLLPSDPLLLMAGPMTSAQFLQNRSAAEGWSLVWARIADSPLTEAGQQPAFQAIARAEAAVQGVHPRLTLLWSGVNRFAAASRQRIEMEIKWLNVCSAAAVLVIGSVFLRRPWKILLLLPIVACSFLGAWTAATAAFSRLHVLVFVIGSLLSGVAIDYGFYIYLQAPARPDEAYGEKLARLRRPLLASCLTTVLGFSLLLFSDLPFIRQVGFFVSAGLLTALAAAALYFAQFRHPYLEARLFRQAEPARRHPAVRRGLLALFYLALAVAGTAPWRLHWKDDIRELDVPLPDLEGNEARLRSLFGEGEGRSLYLTYGSDVAEARRRLAGFLGYERRSEEGREAVSLGAIFPTEEDWKKMPERLDRLAGFPFALQKALAAHGFDSGAFAPFFEDWKAVRQRPSVRDYASLYTRMAGAITGPLAQLYQPRRPLAWFITIVDRPDAAAPPPGLGTVGLDELQTLNGLFSRYRWSALRLSLIGLALVVASVFVIYPLRSAVRIALIPAGSCFFVLGSLALAGHPLNLFHLLGAFLGLCLAHNYAIFSAETSRLRRAPPAAVRLSACCAAASFGVLACSRIPVVHSLGLTVCLIVLTALVAVELEPDVRRAA